MTVWLFRDYPYQTELEAHVATSDEAVVEELMAITLEWMAERGLR